MDLPANASSFLDMLGGQVLARIGVGVILTDGSGCIQWANSRQQWFTGVTAALLLGVSTHDHPWFTTSGVDDAVKLALDRGVTRQLFLQQHQLSCRIEVMPLAVQGRYLGAAILLYNTNANHTDTNSGAVLAAAHMLRPEASEQRVLLQLLRSLLDHLPFAVAVLDDEQGVIYANAPALLRSGNTGVGFSWQEMIPKSFHQAVAAEFLACQKDEKPHILRDQGLGGELLHITLSCMQTEDGLPLYVMAIGEPASSDASFDAPAFTKQMANLCNFAARVVHDIRNPLCALMCELELLRHENLYEEGGVHKFHSAIDLFQEEVGKINAYLEEIEPLGSHEAAQFAPAQLENVMINACSVAELNRPYKGSHIVTDIPHGYPDFYCDSLRMQKVIAGLLDYAMREAGAAGSVHLSLRHSTENGFTISIVFMNSATNLPKPIPQEPLWRSANFRLAMASAIVVELGGRMQIRRYQGQGTEICMIFPFRIETTESSQNGHKISN